MRKISAYIKASLNKQKFYALALILIISAAGLRRTFLRSCT